MATVEMDLSQIGAAVESLRQDVARLAARTASLEDQLASSLAQMAPKSMRTDGKSKSDDLSEETVMVICAAVAAYLGVQAPIRQIRLLHSHPWGQQGRVTIQASHRISVQHA